MAGISPIQSASPQYLSQLLNRSPSASPVGESQNQMGGGLSFPSIEDLKTNGSMNMNGSMPKSIEGMGPTYSPMDMGAMKSFRGQSSGVGKVFGDFISDVHTVQLESRQEAMKVMTGESNNLHQAMIKMQESGVAFSLLVEMRNKLMESFQEIMRMQV